MADGTTRRAVALVIGVGNYPSPKVRRLPYAVKDATAVAAALRDEWLCGFPPAGVVELIDANATRDAIIHHLSVWLPTAAVGADLVFLYFAGHGVMAPVGGQLHGFYLPHDADPDNPVARGVDMAFVAECTKDLSAAAVVLCLDCCHAGAVIPRGPETRDLGIRPAALQPLFAGRQGRYVWTACDDQQSSFEAEELGHGLFTHFVLDGLEAADHTGVELDSLFNSVAEQVGQFAHKRGVVQTPWKLVTSRGQVYLIEPSQGPHPPPPPPLDIVLRIVQQLTTADEADRERLLHRLGRLAQPPAREDIVRAAIPAVIAHLADLADKVKQSAHQAFQAIGSERSFSALVALARELPSANFLPILLGLNALKADIKLVRLLDRLTDELTGDALLQAHEVLDRKRQSLGLAEIAEVFRREKSPYPPIAPLGTGLFALAYQAEHVESKVPIVVRVLRADFASLPDVRKQFIEIAKKAMLMNHGNLIKTINFGRFIDDNIYYTARSFVDGVTLKNMIDRNHQFRLHEVIAILRPVLSALVEVHEHGVCHGGVKPSNIFRGSKERVTLGDLTPPLQGMGRDVARLAYDYRYVAPEVAPATPGGPAADVYAVGCLAFELLTGRPPYVGNHYLELAKKHDREPVPSARALKPDLGPEVDRFLQMLLAKDPSDRPSAEAALAALGGLLRPPYTPTQQKPPGPRPGPPDNSVPDQTLARYRPIVSAMSIGDSWEDMDSHVAESGSEISQRPGSFSGPEPGVSATSVSNENSDNQERTVVAEQANFQSHPALRYPFLSAPDRPTDLGRLGRYRVVRLLGEGGMGFVFRAEDDGLRRPVALKVMRPEVATQPDTRERFLREGPAAAAIKSDHVITIYEVGEANGVVYLAMEFLEGQNLDDWLKTQRPPVPVQAVIRVAKDVLKGLAAAHEKGLIHRDIKPANLWVETGSNRIKLLDFGLTRGSRTEMELTSPGQILGSPAYMSPEQARALPVDARADLFSLGAVLYRMLSGTSPFGRPDLMQTMFALAYEELPSAASLGANIPNALATLIDRLLAKRAQDRPESAKAALAVLDEVERQLHAGRSSSPEDTRSVVSAGMGRQEPSTDRLEGVSPIERTYFEYPNIDIISKGSDHQETHRWTTLRRVGHASWKVSRWLAILAFCVSLILALRYLFF